MVLGESGSRSFFSGLPSIIGLEGEMFLIRLIASCHTEFLQEAMADTERLGPWLSNISKDFEEW
jgi:hypothetical protein